MLSNFSTAHSPLAGGWHRLRADTPELEAVWRGAAAAGSQSIFQSYGLTRAWLEVFGSGLESLLWVRWDPPAIAPFIVRGETLALAGSGLFDYPDLLGAIAAPAQRELAVRLRGDGGWSRLEVNGLRRPSPYEVFWEALGGEWAPFARAPRLTGTSAAAWRSRHRRYGERWRRAQRHGIELTAVIEPVERARLLEWMLDRKNADLAEKGVVSVLGGSERQWMRRIVALTDPSAELWLLHRGGAPLAALLGWCADDVRYGYTICYDKEAGDISPGILLLFAVIDLTLAQQRSFDFLTGEQPYKLRLANSAQELWRVSARAALARGPRGAGHGE